MAAAFQTLASQLSDFTGGEDGLSFKVPEALTPAFHLTSTVDGRIRRSARSRDMSSVAEAPSESCDELPAVTVPWPLSLSKCGGSDRSASSVVSARLHSSRST